MFERDPNADATRIKTVGRGQKGKPTGTYKIAGDYRPGSAAAKYGKQLYDMAPLSNDRETDESHYYWIADTVLPGTGSTE